MAQVIKAKGLESLRQVVQTMERTVQTNQAWQSVKTRDEQDYAYQLRKAQRGDHGKTLR